MIEHLVIVPPPRCGLCNRIRAIASSYRVAEKTGARLSVVWEWGDYRDFFSPKLTSKIEWVSSISPDWSNYSRFATPLANKYTDYRKRLIPTANPNIIVTSPHIFSYGGDPDSPISILELAPYLPSPSDYIERTVANFKRNNFGDTVGVHMRRTDNRRSMIGSPDYLYVRAVRSIIRAGKDIFLATDCHRTMERMRRRFGSKVIIYPKQWVTARRWPQVEFNREMLLDDTVDLFLLVAADYIVGSPTSSFSMIAMTYNNSPLNRPLWITK